MSGIHWIKIAGICGAAGVIIGAFGAHSFEKLPMVQGFSNSELETARQWLETGVRYHFYHTAAILGFGIVKMINPKISSNVAGYGFLFGIVVFSGTLYVMSLTNIRMLGMVVPIGGLSFIAGWIALAYGCQIQPSDQE